MVKQQEMKRVRVSSINDLDGDGMKELLIGSHSMEKQTLMQGKAYVYWFGDWSGRT